MYAFIYIFENSPSALDEIEDALESSLGGRGEVTGCGTGETGSNIDVFIGDGIMSEEEALQLIRQSLADFKLPASTRAVIDGNRHTLA